MTKEKFIALIKALIADREGVRIVGFIAEVALSSFRFKIACDAIEAPMEATTTFLESGRIIDHFHAASGALSDFKSEHADLEAWKASWEEGLDEVTE